MGCAHFCTTALSFRPQTTSFGLIENTRVLHCTLLLLRCIFLCSTWKIVYWESDRIELFKSSQKSLETAQNKCLNIKNDKKKPKGSRYLIPKIAKIWLKIATSSGCSESESRSKTWNIPWDWRSIGKYFLECTEHEHVPMCMQAEQKKCSKCWRALRV